MIIQNNIMALNAQRQMSLNNLKLQTSLEKLSSGYRINRAADDAAGLAISEKMRAQVTGVERAIMNAQDGVQLVQTAEGAMTEVHSMLNRLVDLAGEAANGTLQDSQRSSIQKEADDILKEIDRISQATNFNGIKLLDGSLADGAASKIDTSGVAVQTTQTGADTNYSIAKDSFALFDGTNQAAATFTVNGSNFALVNDADFDTLAQGLQDAGVTAVRVQGTSGSALTAQDLGAVASAINQQTGLSFTAGADAIAATATGTDAKGLVLQIGDTADAYNKLTINIGDMSAKGLGLEGLDFSTQEGASASLARINQAVEAVSTTRGELGAAQNRLEYTVRSLGVTHENISAAEGRIRDTDMAKELMRFAKQNVLSQVSQAMLAQANLQTQQVLQLLK
ncbi:flagellin [Ruminococcaceae bacterium OttesenSCG-928-O06]|nr:flagellin [Ruminococcaceae bacterium OttesenSCG-928-O06]